MNSFNVLDRRQELHRNYLLEASAGTGKTYSIENIVARLLLDEDVPYNLENLLIVTFTKAACSDLRSRIRENLAKILLLIKQNGDYEKTDMPDYLLEVLERGPHSRVNALRKLENSLTLFDQAPIYTIHSFCSRMLREYLFEGNVNVDLSSNEEGIPNAKMFGLIRDFFRTEIKEDLISPAQLELLLSKYKSVEDLQKKLLKNLRGIDIEPSPSYRDLLSGFCQTMKEIKQKHQPEPAKIIEDFLQQANLYKDVCGKGGQPKPENVEKVKKFAHLFTKDEWDTQHLDILIKDGLYFVDALHPSQLKAKKQAIPELLHYPFLASALDNKLNPLIKEANSPERIFLRVIFHCQKMIRQYLKQEDLMGHDELLQTMKEALQNPAFSDKVSKRYRAVIIDEFQDTDPVQWEIFQHLFLQNGRPHVYLVGDPKQAIYSFRQGDIYTYLKAGNALGKENHATLDTNYRSSPQLVSALNTLFDGVNAPYLITLPRLNKTLTYHPVKCGGKTKQITFQDDRGCVHFFAAELEGSSKGGPKIEKAEEEFFFPFIAQEIIRMRKLDGCSFNQFAVLAKDKQQISHLTHFFRKMGIPFASQKSESLVKKPILNCFREVFYPILYWLFF